MKRKTIIDKLDRLIGSIVRDLGECEHCHQSLPPEALCPHHFYTRGNLALRWSLTNLFCLCDQCHTKDSEFSAHLTPEKFKTWAIQSRGIEWYNKLRDQERISSHWTNDQLEDLYKKIKNYYGRLQ